MGRKLQHCSPEPSFKMEFHTIVSRHISPGGLFVFHYAFSVNGFRITLLLSAFSSSLVSNFLLLEIQLCKMLVTWDSNSIRWDSYHWGLSRISSLFGGTLYMYYMDKNILPPPANVQPQLPTSI